MTTPANLLALAPTDLPVLRDHRYDGGGFGVPMAHFVSEDQVLLRQVYDEVKGVYDLWLTMRVAPDYPALWLAIERLGADPFMEVAQRLGRATFARGKVDPLIYKVVHDVRGGGLTALLGMASLLNMGFAPEPLLDSCVFMARDHAKIMRNALTDIDAVTRDQDEAARAHNIDHFIEKWHQAAISVNDRRVVVDSRSAFGGSISARCLETSAIDRILYNHLNNAARFAADGRVSLDIFPVGKALVRWVVSNALSPEQRRWLEEKTGLDLRQLYRGGLTHGGQGLGLNNCADFMAACFGLAGTEEAIERKYLGATVVDDRYFAWFHWPAVVSASGPDVS